jgi:NAD(P)-dependent dehydrogenase (short-subunit alcohol dehydrogenase family)
VEQLNAIVEEIANKHGRLDGLIAAAGIQQETPALEYTAKDVDMMMSVNLTGCFMTAQAAAKQMVRFGNGGSIVMIASMSGTIANRVGYLPPLFSCELLFPLNYVVFEESYADLKRRDSSVPPTTHPKPPSSSSAATWPPNGASTASASTPYLPATSSPPWLKHYSRNSQSGKQIGLRRIC